MIFSVVFAYLIGSIPTGYWFAKYLFNLDITQHGSGNIGASNIARVLGKRYFFVIFALDAIKAVLVLSLVPIGYLIPSAVMLLVGNAYSIFLGFRGGKGVATSIGILSVLLPYQAGIFVVIWASIILLLKRADLASLVSTLMITAYSSYVGVDYHIMLFLCFLNLWVLFRHRDNLVGMYQA